MSALEAVTWIRCPDHENLVRLAAFLDDYWPELEHKHVAPEPHRRFLISHWEKEPEGDEEPWVAAWSTGLVSAAAIVIGAREAGIAAELYAVHVQPVGAEYPPDTQEALAKGGREPVAAPAGDPS